MKYDNISLSVKNNSVEIFDIIEELLNSGVKNIDNAGISFYEPELKAFVYCGIIPNLKNISIPLKLLDSTTGVNEITIRARFIPPKAEKLKMELIEEEHEHTEENNSSTLGKKSRRSKERKLGFIIEKVFLWRKLFNGYFDEKKGFVKLTLEDAAQKVGISKKSLDDYLNQLK